MSVESRMGSDNTKHKVFLSFYHKDQDYKENFERKFGNAFINKSVKKDEISPDLSTEYIKRLIQEDKITGTSVIVVLIGPKTYCRKHVDWEISAALNRKVGGYSGLMGILLPEYPLAYKNEYSSEDIPSRLADNVKSGYAKLYTWEWVCASEQRIRSKIDEAFQSKNINSNKINNSRVQFSHNRCE